MLQNIIWKPHFISRVYVPKQSQRNDRIHFGVVHPPDCSFESVPVPIINAVWSLSSLAVTLCYRLSWHGRKAPGEQWLGLCGGRLHGD